MGDRSQLRVGVADLTETGNREMMPEFESG